MVDRVAASPDDVQNIDLQNEKHFSHFFFRPPPLGVEFELNDTEAPTRIFALFPPLSHPVKPPF